MGLRIIYGKPGSGKSQYCFDEIANIINEEKKIFVITPEQFSFTAEKKLMDAVNTRAVMNAEVITLSRMAYRVIGEIGGVNKTRLSKCGKAMLIYSILSKNKSQLKFLGKSDENIDLSLTAITEFKKHNISIQDLEEETEKIDDIYLKTKLKDMMLIYQNFEDQISGKYIEETDLLTILANNLQDTDLVKNSIIYIDEFAGFTHQEYEVLKQFVEFAKQVNITICIDNLELKSNPDIDIYYSNRITLQKIINLADENNITLEEPVYLEKGHRFKTKELKHLTDNIQNIKATKYAENVENLHLFLAKNQYSEVEEIAKEITKLVRNKNLRYKDISIITKNIETYSSLVRAIFDKYEIPVFIDEKRDLNQNIIVQYVLSTLEILVQNFSNESIFNYIKLGFSGIEPDEVFKLENYVAKWGIKQNKWKRDFEFEKENQEQEIERLNEIRRQIINPILKLKENIFKERTAENITKNIYQFWQEQKIEEKINEKIEDLKERDLLDLANEYVSSYKIILDILDEIVLIFGDDKMTFDQYSKILKVGLKNSGLGKIPGTQDQVIFGDVDRSRSHKVNTVFIIGLNDGSFPSVNKDEGFFNDADREKLKEDGLELAKGTIDRLYEDNFNIYKAFTTAENQIFLSYASSDGEGKSLRPSMLVNKIKKIFPNLKEESDVINKKYEIMNEKITYEQLLENIAKLRNKEKIEDIWYAVYKYYDSQVNGKSALVKDLEGLNYTNLPQKIKKENIDKLYGNVLNTSVSRLEKYRSCPFSYFLQYGLKLKEKEELKVQSFNTGSFMHETIDEFFEYVKEEGIDLSELEADEEKITEIVSLIIDKNLGLSKNFIFTATAKYKALVKRLKRIVSKALKYIIQSLIYSDFSIEGTEVEFGKKGKYKPIILELEDGKKIEITGKIDRIDTAEEEDGKYLRIIDYKSSAKNIDLNEVYAGLQIQLLTYTDAICREEDVMPAGIFYFSLLEQMIKADKKISDEQIEELIRKNFRMKGLIIADVRIIKMNDNTLKTGSSKLVPAAITASGTVNQKWTNGVEKEEFRLLQEYIYKTIKQIGKEILSGKIDLMPYNKKGKTPCEYCEYKRVCGFNPQQNDNKYNYIDKKSKDDILLKIKKELQK